MAPLKLFCFPYAGGCSWAFRQLESYLAGRIDVVAVELPGHGRRCAEPCIDNWADLTSVLTSELEPHVGGVHAFLGYSFGALVALEVTHELARRRAPARPLALIACASPGPRAVQRERLLHRMDDRTMLQALHELGGIPDEVLVSPELIALTAPSLRADLALYETYSQASRIPCDVPIHAYYGGVDTSVGETFRAWRHETADSFHSRAFDGGHMFLHSAVSVLADALAADLGSYGRQLKTA